MNALAQPQKSLQVDDLHPRLAAELAAQLSDRQTIQSRYGLTDDDLRQLLSNTIFVNMLQEAKATWNADMNASERVRIKALIATEEMLPELYAIVWNAQAPMAGRLEASKQITALAGMDAKSRASKLENEGGGGSGFSITINLGDKPEDVITISGDHDAD